MSFDHLWLLVSVSVLKSGLSLSLSPAPLVGHLDFSPVLAPALSSENDRSAHNRSTRQFPLFVIVKPFIYVHTG